MKLFYPGKAGYQWLRSPAHMHAHKKVLRGDSCVSCHEEASIKPQRKRGQRQHAEARTNGTTCIDCHYNLVHKAVESSEAFLNAIESP